LHEVTMRGYWRGWLGRNNGATLSLGYATIPGPSTWLLLAVGAATLLATCRRR
jgi:hypothetical protein